MADTIKIRRDTRERWEQANVILDEAEIGLIVPRTQSLSDGPVKCRIGDGIHAWLELPEQSFLTLGSLAPESASGMLPIYDGSGSLVPSSESLQKVRTEIDELDEAVYSPDLRLDMNSDEFIEYKILPDVVTFSWTASKFDEPAVPEQITYYRSGSDPADNHRWTAIVPEVASGSWSDQYSKIGTITYGIEMPIKNTVVKVERSITRHLASYYGLADGNTTAGTMAVQLNKVVTDNFGSEAGKRYTINGTLGLKYLALVVPDYMPVVNEVRCNGIAVPMQDPVPDSIYTGTVAQPYKVYRSVNQVLPGNSMIIDVYTA